MAIYGVSITKRVTFRGQPQEFSNVYHYDFPTIIGAADGDSLIDNITTREKLLHSSDVTFVLGRVWSAGGSPAANNMLTEKALTGTGSQGTSAAHDRERAVLIQWPAGLNVRGRPVYLRKWYHSCGGCAGVVPTSAALQNTAQIPGADRTTIETSVNNLNTMSAGANTGTLVAQSGRARTGTAACYPWLEHHQLGDAWRAS